MSRLRPPPPSLRPCASVNRPTCRRNAAGTGYPDPVPKSITRFQIRVIDTWFLHSLLMKNAILACLCISLCDDFDFTFTRLFATIGRL